MIRNDIKRTHEHLFGPVPSRRLGRSLGVDLVPHKVCTLDCRYCECGATTRLTLRRRAWVDTADVLRELEAWLQAHPDGGLAAADHLTFSGAGEPTLNVDLGRIIQWLSERTTVPLALLTNGTLLGDAALRAELAPLSVICPSLDTAREDTFRSLNRPHAELTAAALVEALVALRQDYVGEIWLEVLLADGVNDTDLELDALAEALARIRPDRIQLNTAVRPGADSTLGPASAATLERALEKFGPRAKAIATFSPRHSVDAQERGPADLAEQLLAVVRRRPETLATLSVSLGVAESELRRCVESLLADGALRTEERDGAPYLIATERA